MDITVYRCDPVKNKSCKKSYCVHNGTGECNATKNVVYAQTDENGRPIIEYLIHHDIKVT